MKDKTPRIDPGIQALLTESESVLRDQFALAAMQGLCASGAESATFIAERAYLIADAMMKQRELEREGQ